MKKIKKILLLTLLSPLVFVIYQVIRVNNIYINSKMTTISINPDSFSNLLNDFYLGPIKFNDAYLIDKKDTIISFEINEKSGLIWIISELDQNTINVDFFRELNLGDCKDGTFINYSVSKKPIIKISYNKDNGRPQGDCKFVYSSRIRGTSSKSINNINRLLLDSSLELRNMNNELFYRVDCGCETELFTFHKASSIYCIFFQ